MSENEPMSERHIVGFGSAEPDYRYVAPGSPPIKPLALALRVDSFDAAHVHVSVFAGPDDGHRAHVGHLTLSAAEWDAMQDRNLADMGMPGVVMLAFDVIKPIRTVVVMSAPDLPVPGIAGRVDQNMIDQNHADDIGAQIREREIGR